MVLLVHLRGPACCGGQDLGIEDEGRQVKEEEADIEDEDSEEEVSTAKRIRLEYCSLLSAKLSAAKLQISN